MKKDLTTANTTRSERSLLAHTEGAGLVEYIILVGLIALATIQGFRTFGDTVNERAEGLGQRVGTIGQE